EKWRAQVEMPFANHLPRSAAEMTVTGAVRASQWVDVRPPDDPTVAQFFAELDKGVLKRLDRMIPGGKSTLPVLRVAHSLGIPFTHLGNGVYQLGRGSRACRIDRSTTPG